MTNNDTVASKPSFDINFDNSFDIGELSQQIEQSVTSQAVSNRKSSDAPNSTA